MNKAVKQLLCRGLLWVALAEVELAGEYVK